MTSPSSTEQTPAGGVVVGDDGSRRALDALEYAAEEAARRGAPLTVVRTWNIKNAVRPEGMGTGVVPSTAEFQEATTALTRSRAEAAASAHGVEVRVIVKHAPATALLLDLSRTADVVVVGDRGVGGLAGRFIGSVADVVVREADCPVIVVRRHA